MVLRTFAQKSIFLKKVLSNEPASVSVRESIPFSKRRGQSLPSCLFKDPLGPYPNAPSHYPSATCGSTRGVSSMGESL